MIHFKRAAAIRSLLPVLGSILSGVLLALGFPGFGSATLVYAALVPLMFAVHTAPLRKTVWLALLSGFIFFMISLNWLHNLTGTVEGIGLKLSVLAGYSALAFYCALYFIPFAIVVALGSRQWGDRGLWANIRFMGAVSLTWVGSEYLRGVLFTGFPWNPLGVSQYTNAAIIQIAEWGGVSMVSACIVWMNAGIFVTLRQYIHGTRMKTCRPHFELMIGILPIALSMTYGMKVLLSHPVAQESINVALIQPNIPQTEKWDSAQDQHIRDRLEELTSAAMRLGSVDLIIWPETAVPDFVRASQPSYDLIQRMTTTDIPLLAGSMDIHFSESGRAYYNSSILFGQGGKVLGKYDKQHLVPFGEYVPFPTLMRKFTPVDVDFRHGAGSTILPLTGKAPFSVLICFEDTVAPLAVNATRAGARWLVNQTNDAWFDPSAQSEQHLAHAVFRCIENRIPLVRCCNTGVTCIIGAYGSIERNLEPRTCGFTTGMLSPRPDGLAETFYTRNGDLFAQAGALAGIFVLFALGFQARRPGQKKG